jgi:TPR repeat protein
MMHATGDGVDKDLGEAYWWVHQAVARSSGEQRARYAGALEDLSGQMTPGQVAACNRRIAEWRDEPDQRSSR